MQINTEVHLDFPLGRAQEEVRKVTLAREFLSIFQLPQRKLTEEDLAGDRMETQ